MNSVKAFGVIGLVVASLALPAQAASPAAEASARLLARVASGREEYRPLLEEGHPGH